MANYNEEAVSKAIKADPSIGGAEAKAIHGLLKGRGRGPAAFTVDVSPEEINEVIDKAESTTADCTHADLSLVARGFGAKQQNEIHCRCGLRWKISADGNRLVAGEPAR